MPPGENPSGRVQIHPASFRYDSSANSDTPKLRKPTGITAPVKHSSCFYSTVVPDPSSYDHPSSSTSNPTLIPFFPSSFPLDLWPCLPGSYSTSTVPPTLLFSFHGEGAFTFFPLFLKRERDRRPETRNVGHFSRASKRFNRWTCPFARSYSSTLFLLLWLSMVSRCCSSIANR